MSASPLIVTFNYPTSLELDNNFVNAPTSPLPGTSAAILLNLQSPNFNVQNATLTIQFYNNLVAPATPTSVSSLVVKNITIIASSATNTIGTLSYVLQFQNPVNTTDPLLTSTRVATVSSFVTSASGIFASYLFGNVIQQSDVTTGNRTISIYSAE